MHLLLSAAVAAAVVLSDPSAVPLTQDSEATVVPYTAPAAENGKATAEEEDTLKSERSGSFSPAAALSAIRIDGSWEMGGHALSEIPIAANGATLGQRYYVDHRLRLAPRVLVNPHTTVFSEFDLLRGPWAGDVTPDFPNLNYDRSARYGFRPSSIDLRELYVQWQSSVGVLRLGQQTSHWGLGIVANHGKGDALWGGSRFHGDLVERVVFATRPLAKVNDAYRPLLTYAGADLVYRDQSAQLVEGDRAFQGVVGVVWAPEEADSRAGVYIARRSQVDRDGFDLNAWVFDVHGRYVRALSENARLRLEAEIAHVRGTTNMVRDIYFLERDLEQLGAAAEIALELERFDAIVQTGYASGDANLYDDKVTSFEFDPEYRVGFILFQEVLAWQTAASAGAASDPLTSGRPAAGARLLPTEGAVANAVFVAPTARFHITRDFNVQAGVLWAQTAQDFVDAYTTSVNGGGYPLTVRGAKPTSRDLGLEADIGVSYTLRDYDRKRASFYLQAGRFFPGAAFDAPLAGSTDPAVSMDPVDRVLAGVNLYW